MAEINRTQQEKMDMLKSAADGTRVAHVWRSPHYPGADMKIQYRWPDIEVGPDDHGCPEEFAVSAELEYAGTLTREEATYKLAEMKLATDQATGEMEAL